MSLDYHPGSKELGVIIYPDRGMFVLLWGIGTLMLCYLQMWNDYSLMLTWRLPMARQ